MDEVPAGKDTARGETFPPNSHRSLSLPYPPPSGAAQDIRKKEPEISKKTDSSPTHRRLILERIDRQAKTGVCPTPIACKLGEGNKLASRGAIAHPSIQGFRKTCQEEPSHP